MGLFAVSWLERILRRMHQLFSSALTRSPGPGRHLWADLDVALVRGQTPVPTGVRIETATSLWDHDRRPAP